MVTLTQNWHWCCDLQEWRGSLDTLDASIDGVDIPLFLNSCDIFAKTMLVLLSLLQ